MGFWSDFWDKLTGSAKQTAEAPKDLANAAAKRQNEVRTGSINPGANPSSISMDPHASTPASGDPSSAASGDKVERPRDIPKKGD